VMELSSGSPEAVVGMIDGAVATDHPDFAAASIRQLEPPPNGPRERANHAARAHGTYVAGILSARRGSAAPAVCPGCTLLVRPIFLDTPSAGAEMPSATPDELADAIVECVDAGAQILNLSVAVSQPSP
jgi:subtilisin family serine protease